MVELSFLVLECFIKSPAEKVRGGRPVGPFQSQPLGLAGL